ncbi:thymidylate kinase-domain-containing protein [Mycena floridula]|nr:thymidylate kinase-domain-containing protein [Mycena floridula]
MVRAALIVIEGLDRSGKTTQTAKLSERLGDRATLLKFPDRTTTIGKMIDSYLQSKSELDDHVIHLLFSANRWEFATKIEELLNQGIIVICDRYAFSGISFSASKGLSLEWCRSPDVSLPAPDLTLFMDITPEKAKERGGYGEERYEKMKMQQQVRKIFEQLGDEAEAGSWVTIDAGRDMETVSKDIWEHIGPLVNGVEGPIKRLWMDKITT